METARIAPGSYGDVGALNWVVCKVASVLMRVPSVHLFSTLARQRSLFRSWLRFSSELMPGGTLPRFETELVILRIAQLRSCQYERDHHVRIGRRAGVNAKKLAQVERGPDAPEWDDKTRALLRGVDSLVEKKDIDDTTWSALARHFSSEQLVELCFLVGQYEMLATTIKALRIQRDY